MTLETWDIDRFPVKTAVKTPGQRDADRWLSENHPDTFAGRPPEPGDLDRLTREHQDDPNDRFFGVPTGGGGLGHGDGMHYPVGGHNRPDRRYVDETGEYGHLPGHEYTTPQHGDYWLQQSPHIDPFGGIFGPDEDEDEADSFRELEPTTYHVAVRPVGSDPHDRGSMIEHRVHTMGNRFEYEPSEVWEQFAQENQEFDPENNPDATHEIVDVHPEANHDSWHNGLASEEESFQRIAPHGLRRESDEIIGHKAYRHEDPHGGVHRLWHSSYSSNGPGWHTSYYRPELEQDQQTPWTEHPDNRHADSLGEALKRVDRMKTHADVVHSGTGLEPVENLHGVHYVSRRPDGSPHQMLRNFDDSNGNDNWNVVHYPADGSGHTYTEHGADLTGALAQAKSNLTRG